MLIAVKDTQLGFLLDRFAKKAAIVRSNERSFCLVGQYRSSPERSSKFRQALLLSFTATRVQENPFAKLLAARAPGIKPRLQRGEWDLGQSSYPEGLNAIEM